MTKKLDDFSPEELLKELKARKPDTPKNNLNKKMKNFETALYENDDSAPDLNQNPDLENFKSSEIIPVLHDKQKAIYGVDDRKDLWEIQDQNIINSADSTVALIYAENITDNGDGTSTIYTEKFKDSFNLCSKETFADQPCGAFCSGFLIKDDIVATAGHCVDDEEALKNIRFVFGFRMTDASTAQVKISNTEIYEGSKLIDRKFTANATDWALVKLDRKVTNHRIATFRKTGKINNNEKVYVIGHPCGLPLKYAPGAKVRNNSAAAFFVANLDTYGGNSGSAVFNSSDHTVEGILVRGTTDFVQTENNCNVSNVCPTTGCSGESVTRATEFSSEIP